MKQLFVIFLIGFLAIETFGQQSVDIGFFGGAGTYFGDMTKTNFQKSVNPAYGSFVRYNFNPRYALKFNVMNGNMSSEGEFESNYCSFSKNVLDVSLQFEFNYFKYIVGDIDTPWSTYLFGGIGMQAYNYELIQADLDPIVHPTFFAKASPSGSVFTPTIPFGLGFKVNLSERWGMGIEGGLRKSFSDKLDNLDDPLSYTTIDEVQVKFTDQYHNNDWTAYMGIHMVYKLLYGNKQWELKTSKKKMLDWGIWNSNRKE